MNKNGIQFNSKLNLSRSNGLGGLKYYTEIPRTSDLLKTAEFSVHNSSDLLISRFYIAPATLRFDDMVEEAIYEINFLLSKKLNTIPDEDILNDSIEKQLLEHFKEIDLDDLTAYLDSGNKGYIFQDVTNSGNALKEHLIEKGHTGKLIEVASSLNASRIDQLTRTILSEEGIFFYLAFRAIKGQNIKDADGISTSILGALGNVKSFLNKRLIDKVITKALFNVSAEERTNLKETIKNQRLSYAPGSPEKFIEKLVEETKSSGKLFKQVMIYLNSGKVKLPRNTNKTELAKKMVDYLIQNGFNQDFEDNDNSSDSNSPDDNDQTINNDQFQVLSTIGPKREASLYKIGITTYDALAEYHNKTDLLFKQLKINDPTTNLELGWNNAIMQAKLISQGKIKDFLDLKEKERKDKVEEDQIEKDKEESKKS